MELDSAYSPLSPELNYLPSSINHVHLMGICGTGMASLAGMLKDRGLKVTGSDQNVYPPMSDYLKRLSIPVMEGYGPENLHQNPDLVIVGNVITRQNPEARELGRLRIPFLSFPQAISELAIKGKKAIVIAGTHGKTTTTSLGAWLLQCAGLDPGFMIGGVPGNFDKSFRVGTGPYFVIEGDEYDTAFFDKGPKFLHYRPWVLILTSIEFDHADIYRDLAHVLDSFRKLLSIVPDKGYVIANGDDKNVAGLLDKVTCHKISYGFNSSNSFRASEVRMEEHITRFRLTRPGKPDICLHTNLYGRHNLSNLLSVAALSHVLDIPEKSLRQALSTYKGVKRRQEILGEINGILVIDDFAHHPTSVKETILAVKGRYPKRRIIAVFEPRSNSSRRNVFQQVYTESFYGADMVYISEPPLMHKIPPTERFSSKKLVQDLKQKGISATYAPSTDSLLDSLLSEARDGDLVLFMSNGAFDNLPRRFLETLYNGGN